jgi:uncharacterized UBP type Zn finger protein
MPVVASTSKQKITNLDISSTKKKTSNSTRHATQMNKSPSVISQPRKQQQQQDTTHPSNSIQSNSSDLSFNGKKVFLTKCPHVILIGNLGLNNLDVKNIIAYQQEKRKKSESLESSSLCASHTSSDLVKYEKKQDDEQIIATDTHLTCEECDKRKNLWLCLRDDCRFVGCGQDTNSNKHSNLHSMVEFIFLCFSN